MVNLQKTKHKNIYKDEKGRYWVIKMIQGERFRQECGKTVSAAKAYLSRITEEARRAVLFPDEKEGVKNRRYTYKDLVERYEREVFRDIKPKTVASYRNSDRHLLAFFRSRSIASIEFDHVLDFEAKREDEGASRNSINRDLERLRRLLLLAERDRLINRYPFRGQKLLKKGATRDRYLTEEEEARLRGACDPETWRVIEFAWRTGLRGREQMSLRWSQVTGGVLVVSRTKTDSRSGLPITEAIQSILEAQRGLHPTWIWPNRSRRGHINLDNFRSRRFYPALEKAGVRNFRWHDLRHTFCSRIMIAGGSIADLKDLAGHRSLTTTAKYIHLSGERLRRSMELL